MKRPVHLTRTDFPQGTVVKTEKGRFFINGKTRKPIRHDKIFKSWSFPFVVETNEASLSKFLVASPLGYRDGTLIRDISDNAIYLISGQKRRKIVDPEALLMLGLEVSDAMWVSHKDVLIHQEGNDL